MNHTKANLILVALFTVGIGAIPNAKSQDAFPQNLSPIPPALTGKAPFEVWRPTLLTDQEKKKRATADNFLMKEEVLRSSKMEFTNKLQTELNNKQYDLIENQLDAIQAKTNANSVYELLEWDAAGFAQGNNVFRPVGKAALDAWEAARPHSPWAHYSEALMWSEAGWQVRGNGWAKDVTDAQWAEMSKDEKNALEEIAKTLKINPKITAAWGTLLDIYRTTGTLKDVTYAYAAAYKEQPSSFMLTDDFHTALEPRWFGSYDDMETFASAMQKHISKNPRFWTLQGAAQADQGCAACNGYKWELSLRHYNAALAYGDRPEWLNRAAQAAVQLHHYALAYRYYERESHYKPGMFDLAAEMKIMRALCDPKVSKAAFGALMEDVVRYSDIRPAVYPREAGDCVYYKNELPWGDEPVPNAGNVMPYMIRAVK
jgi:tetratricopeptide (TPR) repeat protein